MSFDETDHQLFTRDGKRRLFDGVLRYMNRLLPKKPFINVNEWKLSSGAFAWIEDIMQGVYIPAHHYLANTQKDNPRQYRLMTSMFPESRITQYHYEDPYSTMYGITCDCCGVTMHVLNRAAGKYTFGLCGTCDIEQNHRRDRETRVAFI